MVKCTFCGSEIERGKGKIFVTKIGAVSYFCSSKCEKNLNMKRKARKLKWTGKREKQKMSKKRDKE